MTALKEWRLHNKLTLMQAATALGVSISTFEGWETGTKGMRVSNLVRVHNVTGIDITTLITELHKS